MMAFSQFTADSDDNDDSPAALATDLLRLPALHQWIRAIKKWKNWNPIYADVAEVFREFLRNQCGASHAFVSVCLSACRCLENTLISNFISARQRMPTGYSFTVCGSLITCIFPSNHFQVERLNPNEIQHKLLTNAWGYGSCSHSAPKMNESKKKTKKEKRKRRRRR